ncbi:hypothetical protein ACX83H_16420 [Burkholderia pseudomallei]|uniref:hypothetical protein n=1 Tax=Burkholderia TaxID=32008 RepID=UPI000F185503|nr:MULTISPECIES: hypothetical protein [Burkholderia]VBG97920.1 Uncharacterised protein [Burkholderia pseudomallei]
MPTEMTNQNRTAAARAALVEQLAGKSPRARGVEKMHAALIWVYRWGWSTISIVEQLGGNLSNGLAARLVKRGLLVRIRTESAGSVKGVPQWLLTLTELGLQEVERVVDELQPYELDPYKIRQDLLRHDAIAQTATVRNLKSRVVAGYLTERQMAQRSKAGVKQPDVLWLLPGGTRMAVEIELSGKWDRHLDQFVSSSLHGLHEHDRFDQLAIVSDSPAIIRRYAAAFAPGAEFSVWKKDDQRRWHRAGVDTVPQWIEGRLTCQLID